MQGLRAKTIPIASFYRFNNLPTAAYTFQKACQDVEYGLSLQKTVRNTGTDGTLPILTFTLFPKIR